MKLKDTVILLAVVFGLSTGVVGCKKRPVGVTPLPGRAAGSAGSDVGEGLTDSNEANLGEAGLFSGEPVDGVGIPMEGGDFSNYNADSVMFQEQTIYFDFDKSTVNPGEIGKLETVAARMGSFPAAALRIEGHCDERGTEEYNRALGERRALAVREALIGLGMSPGRVVTVSYGEDRPADPGHDQAAWAKNRRGEIILLTPPGGATP